MILFTLTAKLGSICPTLIEADTFILSYKAQERGTASGYGSYADAVNAVVTSTSPHSLARIQIWFAGYALGSNTVLSTKKA